MRYQILEQAESGEPWRFYAHGARYGKAEAESALAAIAARGGRSRLIPCGREPGKRKPGKAALVINTSRRSYWRTPAGLYLCESPMAEADAIARRVGGYARLDELMQLKGESPHFIAGHCTPDGHARILESGK